MVDTSSLKMLQSNNNQQLN